MKKKGVIIACGILSIIIVIVFLLSTIGLAEMRLVLQKTEKTTAPDIQVTSTNLSLENMTYEVTAWVSVSLANFGDQRGTVSVEVTLSQAGSSSEGTVDKWVQSQITSLDAQNATYHTDITTLTFGFRGLRTLDYWKIGYGVRLKPSD